MKVIVHDLMIGNIFRDALTGEWLRVDVITRNKEGNHSVGFDVINRDKFPLPNGWYAQPVPLNRDVLTKMCGFEIKIGGTHTEYLLKIDEERDVVIFARTPYSVPGIPGMPHIKYLHQVQNLVLNMANTVLKITLP